MKNKNEVVMVNEETGKETEVHADSIAAMEACGWKVKKGEKVPTTATGAANRSPEEQANDEGAKKATVAQLKEALDGLKIEYPEDAKKADLLELYLARPVA